MKILSFFISQKISSNMLSSKKWAKTISYAASHIYFFIIILQIPLFRFPCRIGVCTSPIEVTSSVLIANEILPEYIVQALVFPGAIVKAILSGSTIPTYQKLIGVYKTSHLHYAAPFSDLEYIEFIVGCYLAVAGAFTFLIRIRSSKLCFYGLLLTLWGVHKEISLTKNYNKAFHIHLMMWIALISAFLSMRGVVRNVIRILK